MYCQGSRKKKRTFFGTFFSNVPTFRRPLSSKNFFWRPPLPPRPLRQSGIRPSAHCSYISCTHSFYDLENKQKITYILLTRHIQQASFKHILPTTYRNKFQSHLCFDLREDTHKNKCFFSGRTRTLVVRPLKKLFLPKETRYILHLFFLSWYSS